MELPLEGTGSPSITSEPYDEGVLSQMTRFLIMMDKSPMSGCCSEMFSG